MSRYFIRPVAAPDGSWDDPMLPPLSVSDHRPVDTGLVNHRGEPIMRGPEPVGFHRTNSRKG
jgi:hypothetical protein